jgi:hypothetical protein
MAQDQAELRESIQAYFWQLTEGPALRLSETTFFRS